MKKKISTAVFFSFLAVAWLVEARAEFMGKIPTGLLQLQKKHEYYLFVPKSYTMEKAWPLILLVGKRADKPEEVIRPWVAWAETNQFLVLTPPNLTPDKDVPESADDWILGLKKEVLERYKVDPQQILLVGLEEGGHYAAYLGTRYPQEFSAAALVHEGWAGPYEKMIKPTSNKRKQLSFFVVADPADEKFSDLERKALEFEQKGYQVTFENLKEKESLATIQERILQWFQAEAEAKSVLKERPRVGFKDKVSGFFEDFFEV